MKAELTPTIFRYISKEISAGRPLWGMLRANEYLHSDSPIRKALASKARKLLNPKHYKLLDEILEQGKTLGELDELKIARLKQVQETFDNASYKTVQLPNRRSHQRRKQVLGKLRVVNG